MDAQVATTGIRCSSARTSSSPHVVRYALGSAVRGGDDVVVGQGVSRAFEGAESGSISRFLLPFARGRRHLWRLFAPRKDLQHAYSPRCFARQPLDGAQRDEHRLVAAHHMFDPVDGGQGGFLAFPEERGLLGADLRWEAQLQGVEVAAQQ